MRDQHPVEAGLLVRPRQFLQVAGLDRVGLTRVAWVAAISVSLCGAVAAMPMNSMLIVPPGARRGGPGGQRRSEGACLGCKHTGCRYVNNSYRFYRNYQRRARPGSWPGHPPAGSPSRGRSTADHRLSRLTTMPSWLLRAMTTTASSPAGFSSRCGTYGGTKM